MNVKKNVNATATKVITIGLRNLRMVSLDWV
jgi:hypothetical protein